MTQNTRYFGSFSFYVYAHVMRKYVLMSIGEYSIEVTYFGQPVTGSPFTAKAWDMNKVTVSNVVNGRVCLQSSFNSTYRYKYM